MTKRILSIILTLSLLIGAVQISFAAEAKASHTEAAYGTPVIDGVIDDLWDKTNHNIIGIKKSSDEDFYRGWFKLMWDEEHLYALAKIYADEFNNSDPSPWNNDSFELFVDEAYNKSTTYKEDDYQLRADFEGNKSQVNYGEEGFDAAGKTYDGYYVVEMSVKLKTIAPEAGTKMGVDIQVNVSKDTYLDYMGYVWSESSRHGAAYKDTSLFGAVTLKQTVGLREFSEPEYVSRTTLYQYNQKNFAENKKVKQNNVIATFDGAEFKADVIHLDDYPCIEIGSLAKIIGAKLVGGDTLVKDKVTIKYTAGDRLAHYTHSDYPNRADYMTTYYEEESDLTSGKGSNTLTKVTEKLLPGEDKSKELSADYKNDGTDGENDGYILEVAPFKDGGKLYVPLYSIKPTLNYYMEYYRFNDPPEIVIETGTNYPAESTFKTFYAKDFGAVGDGVTDDTAAILKGFGKALAYEGPSKFVLEKGKTYRVSERTDTKHFFTIFRKENFVLEGNGSTIVLDSSVNGSVLVRESTNVKIRDITFIRDANTSTHGIIEEINVEEKAFILRFPENVELPPPTDWQSALQPATTYLYEFGQVWDLENHHPKYIQLDHFRPKTVEHLGDRRVKVTFFNPNDDQMKAVEVGDGFVFNIRTENY